MVRVKRTVRDTTRGVAKANRRTLQATVEIALEQFNARELAKLERARKREEKK